MLEEIDKKIILAIASAQCYFFTKKALPFFMPKLLKANLGGIDLNKPHDEKTPKTPEAGGLIPMVVCCSILSLFGGAESLVIPMLSAGLLGFADNVLNLEWRWKIIIPPMTLAPLVRHYLNKNELIIHLYGFLIKIFKTDQLILPRWLSIIILNGFSVYAQNAVNIYAGINGLETGQSLVAQAALLAGAWLHYGTEKMLTEYYGGTFVCILFIFSSLPLLALNRYPAKIFVGDVFTYFAGCTYVAAAADFNCIVLAGILYFMQNINTLLSIPQLIGIVPCPRHRLPKLNEADGLLYGQKINLNLINQYLLRIRRKGLREDQIFYELVGIQIVGSLAILAVYYFMFTKINKGVE